jgi:hypothetical protein
MLRRPAVATEVNEEHHVTCKDFACAHWVSNGTKHNILHEDLMQTKKSTKYRSKHSTEPLRQDSVRGCKEFVVPVSCCYMSSLDNVMLMDESMMSCHIP